MLQGCWPWTQAPWRPFGRDLDDRPSMLRAAAPGPKRLGGQHAVSAPAAAPRRFAGPRAWPRVRLLARVPGPASDCWPACLLAAADDSHLFFYCEQQSALTLP
ncbi:uncharacterized protein LOC120320743 [Drosophila yakuba]|uniref:uncharacterized protein LOC120320743 n=1 Tax=Drosophila yakuba TaxID=7245 RepID=UPI00193075AA|nr:uncharacterized protein LOC120320743 [Drosophila yakuba]